MVYDHENENSRNDVTCTNHLIIDEAHNILNAQNHFCRRYLAGLQVNILKKSLRKDGIWFLLNFIRVNDQQIFHLFFHKFIIISSIGG